MHTMPRSRGTEVSVNDNRNRDDQHRRAADDYARRGWPVLPIHRADDRSCSCGRANCHSPAKHPRTRQGLNDATVELSKIDGWWRRWPHANVGIRTGEVTGIVVLDIDPRHKGDESLDRLISQHGELPATVEALTGGGGRHFVFQHPGQVIRNRANLRPGIDVRGDGGYIVAPPSIHISGGAYAWKPGHAPSDLDPAPLPAWLLDVMTRATTEAGPPSGPASPANQSRSERLIEAALRYVAKAKGVPEGRRNNSAFNLAGHLAAIQTDDGQRLEEAQIFDLLRMWNHKNRPPLAEDELARVASSALRNGTPRKPHVVETTTAISPSPDVACDSTAGELPKAILPGGSQRVIDSAETFGALLAATGCHFLRGGAVTKLFRDDTGARRLQPLKPASMPAVFEQVARLVKVASKNGVLEHVPTTCNEQTAKILSCSEPFQSALPPINVIARCPVLIERDGALIRIVDYDRASGILADGDAVADVSLDEARRLLRGLLCDFRFATEADRSRALAALITPALVLGGLLNGRAPVDLSEANQSQAGKGYRNKITAALYRETIKTVTQRRGGVGSLDETFSSALISGAPFIALDNVRGKIDSPAIESFLTEDRYLARIPYSASVEIDPRRTIVMVTSNKAELTPDLANRSSCVRILKQPPGYTFRAFPEGDLLDHVKANPAMFFGAIVAVISAWFDAGKPTTKEGGHDFRRWARVLDWIVQNLLAAAPIMKGHRQTQQRMANPALTWLRDMALAVVSSKRNDGGWLRTHQLLDIAENAALQIPGAEEGVDLENQEARDKALRGLGKRLATCFGPVEGKLEIDHLVIERRETVDELGRNRKEYCFRVVDVVRNLDVPAFPHTPHEPHTFFTAASTDASQPEDARLGLEKIKVRGARGECGGMRECGEDADVINDLLDEAAGDELRLGDSMDSEFLEKCDIIQRRSP